MLTNFPLFQLTARRISGSIFKIYSEYGWQEYWQYNAETIDSKVAQRKFTKKIDICQSARWYLLKHTVYTSG